jgi:sterol desaturase/sphingolipid hydroxylase (fatty acid hydroxylase superfamily)
MNPIVYAIPVFLVTIVLEAWIARRRGIATYDIPDALTSLHHGVLSQVAAAFSRVVTLGLYVAVWEQFRAFELSASNPLVWVFALLAYDLAYYWYHRMSHEVALFWGGHVVHHSSEYFNLSTALRQSSTSPLFAWMFYVPLAVVGVPPVVFVTVGLIDLLYQYWVHTELVGRLGRLDRILVTPSNHRVHHGQNDYCIDRNYGGIFIFWDRLFGSFAEERGDEKVAYGVRKPLRSWNPLWGNLQVYCELARAAWRAPGIRAKLAVLFSRPGEHGQDNALQADFDVASFRPFSSGTSRAVRLYSMVQYAALVPLISHFIAVQKTLGDAGRVAYALVIVASTVTIGAMLEGRRYARVSETARVALLGAFIVVTPAWFGWPVPDWVRGCVIAFALASAWHLAARSPTPAPA